MGYDDISIVQYESIAKVMEMDIDDVEKGLRIVGIVYGYDMDVLLSMPEDEIVGLCDGVSFLNVPLRVHDIEDVYDLGRELTVNEFRSLTSFSSMLRVLTGTNEYNAVDGMSIISRFVDIQFSRMCSYVFRMFLYVLCHPSYHRYLKDLLLSYKSVKSIRLWQK